MVLPHLVLWFGAVVALPRTVEVSFQDVPEPLAGRVLHRILDSGFTLVPIGEPSDIRLVISRDDDTWVLVTDRPSRRIEVDAASKLSELELLHWSVLVLERTDRPQVGESSEPRTSRPDVVNVSRGARSVFIDDQTGDAAPLVPSLLLVGYAVTPSPTEADFVLCIESGVDAPRVGASTARQPCRPNAPYRSPELPGVALAALGSARQPVLPAGPSAQVEVIPKRPASSLFSVGLGAGVAVRGGTDFTVGADLRFRLVQWFGLELDSLVYLPLDETDIQVVEVTSAVGPSAVIRLAPRWRMSMAFVGGTLFHTYSIDDGDSGLRVDGWLSLPVRASFEVARRNWIQLSLRGSWTSRARSHTSGEDVLWERERLAFGAELGWEFDAVL